MLATLLLVAATQQPAQQQPLTRSILPVSSNGPGCALDVRRAGAVIAAEANGYANLESGAPNNSDTVFEIGSVSKQFIGAGIAILKERRRLNLNDPISKWLPELPSLYRNITISMLVHHTSGIRSWNNIAELTGRSEDSTGYDNDWVLRSMARQRQLNNAPGAEYLYSNSNFVLAAIIVERASGQQLNDFYRDALFEPLGMSQTRWRTDFREVVAGRAQAYLPTETGKWQLDMPLNGVAGAGGLLSTVGDLQRWSAVIANPSPKDREWVTALLRPGALSDGTTLPYGMGIETAPVAGAKVYSHAGSTGSYRAWLGVFPDEQLSIALLCNSGALNTEDLGPEIAARFLPAPSAVGNTSTPTEPPPSELDGLYRNTANDAVVRAVRDATGLRFNGGPRFGWVGGDQLATADGRRFATISRTRSGRIKALTITRIGNAPTVIEPVTAWSPRLAELSPLAGRYSSVEIDGDQRIEIVGTGLVWRDPSGASHRLVPTYPSTFEAPDVSWTLRFRKGSTGRNELDMSITRARRISFQRMASN